MKRVFDEADRIKKTMRVPDTQGEQALSHAPAELAEAIKGELIDGFLPCATAFEIARRLKVPLVAVGKTADDLGVRVIDCRLGCFKVDKTVHDPGSKSVRPEAARAVDSLIAKGPLTCAGVFGVARRLGVAPVEIADAANKRQAKIYRCQLGCF